MKPGILASLTLVAVLTVLTVAIAAAVEAAPGLRDLPPAARLGVTAASALLLFTAAILPFGIGVDRTIAAVRRHLAAPRRPSASGPAARSGCGR